MAVSVPEKPAPTMVMRSAAGAAACMVVCMVVCMTSGMGVCFMSMVRFCMVLSPSGCGSVKATRG